MSAQLWIDTSADNLTLADLADYVEKATKAGAAPHAPVQPLRQDGHNGLAVPIKMRVETLPPQQAPNGRQALRRRPHARKRG